jgi:hypothetical protein
MATLHAICRRRIRITLCDRSRRSTHHCATTSSASVTMHSSRTDSRFWWTRRAGVALHVGRVGAPARLSVFVEPPYRVDETFCGACAATMAAAGGRVYRPASNFSATARRSVAIGRSRRPRYTCRYGDAPTIPVTWSRAAATGPAVSALGPGRSPEPPVHRRCRTAARKGRCGDRTPRRPARCDRYSPPRPTAPGSALARAEAVGWSPPRLGDAAPIVRRGGGRSDWVGWAPTQEVDITRPKSVALSPHRGVR